MAPLTKSEKEQINNLEARLKSIETKITRIQTFVIGLAIGAGVMGVILGVNWVKDIIKVVK
jgi:hypothetical protein